MHKSEKCCMHLYLAPTTTSCPQKSPNWWIRWCSGLMNPKLILLANIQNALCDRKRTTCTTPRTPNLFSERWWWQHCAMEMSFYSRDRGSVEENARAISKSTPHFSGFYFQKIFKTIWSFPLIFELIYYIQTQLIPHYWRLRDVNSFSCIYIYVCFIFVFIRSPKGQKR